MIDNKSQSSNMHINYQDRDMKTCVLHIFIQKFEIKQNYLP